MSECSVCTHPAREDIEAALVLAHTKDERGKARGPGYRVIVRRYVPTVSISTLTRHWQGCLTPSLAVLSGETGSETVARRGTPVEQLQGLSRRAEKILDSAEKDGNGARALAAIKELRAIEMDRARLTGQLDERPVTIVNLQTSPEWIETRTQVVAALCPDCRIRVGALGSQPLELMS